MRPTLNMTCPICMTPFDKVVSVVRTLQKRNPLAKFYCGKGCANAGLLSPCEILDRRLVDYLAGVVCGDGSVNSAGVRICVGLADGAYADVLQALIPKAITLTPHFQVHPAARASYVSVHSRNAARVFGAVKLKSGWDLSAIRHPGEFLAGLCDTDGWWPRCRGKIGGSFSITQKDIGNLEVTLPLWQGMGMNPTLHHYDSGGYLRAVLRIPSCQMPLFREHIPLKHPRKLHPPKGYGLGGDS